MALVIEIPFKKELLSSKSPAEVLSFFKDPIHSIGKNFPGLESLVSLSDETYQWNFKNLSYSGYDLKLQFDTTFHWSSSGLEIRPTGTKGHRLSAIWSLTSEGTGTRIALDMKMTFELPVPSFMKSMVQPLAQKELTKILERFTDSISRALA